MLAEELQVAAHDVLEPRRVERRADHVVRLGAGEEEHLPARLPEPVAPVDFLAHQEEVLVEAADRVHGLPAHEQAGAEQVVRLAHRLSWSKPAPKSAFKACERGATLRRKKYSVAMRQGVG